MWSRKMRRYFWGLGALVTLAGHSLRRQRNVNAPTEPYTYVGDRR